MNRQHTSTLYRMDLNKPHGLGQGWRPYARMPFIRASLLGLLIVLLVLGGVYYKQTQAKNQARAASFLYDRLMNAMKANQESEGMNYAQTVMQSYPKTVYAPLAALMAAAWAVQHTEWDKALVYLQFVLKHAPTGAIAEIARVRSASILSEQQKYEEALALLETIKPAAYVPLVEELKGDIYVLTQKRDQAREAYARAMEALPMGAPLVGRLQLKQIEVGFKEAPKKSDDTIDKKESS